MQGALDCLDDLGHHDLRRRLGQMIPAFDTLQRQNQARPSQRLQDFAKNLGRHVIELG